MITIRNWMATIPPEERIIAYVGEGETVKREFFLTGEGFETFADWSFHLDMAFDLSSVTTRETFRRETTTKTQEEDLISNTTQERTEVQTDTGLTVHSSDQTGGSSGGTSSTVKETHTVTEETVASVTTTDVASLAKSVEPNGIRLTWTVRRQQTQLPGRLRATLRALGPQEEVKKTAIMVFEVQPAVVAEPAATVPVSEFEEMEQRMGALVSKAEQISTRIDSQAAAVAANTASTAANAAAVASDRQYVAQAKVEVQDNAALAQTACDAAQQSQEQALLSALNAEYALNEVAAHRTAADKAAATAQTAASEAKDTLRQTQIHLTQAATCRDAAAESAAEAKACADMAAIRGTASGAQTVRLDNAADVCPATVTVAGADDPTAVTVKRYGKNLLPYPYAETGTKTVNGITFTDNGDGTITANGTATGDAQYKLANNYAPYFSLPPGTYTFSGGINGRHVHLGAGGTVVHKNWIGAGNILTVTFAEGDVMQNLYCTVQSGTTVTNKVFYPMVELSPVATAYEPYVETESYTPGTDGTVEIPMLPTTTLVADAAGVTVAAEYTQDATALVASLTERIAALEAIAASAAVIPE